MTHLSARFGCIFFLAIVLAACSSGPRVVPVDDRHVKHSTSGKVQRYATTSQAGRDWVTVSKGDTLFSVSFAHGYDFKTIARLNNIKSPYTIYPGQKLRLRGNVPAKSKSKTASRKSTSRTTSSKKSTSTNRNSSKRSTPVTSNVRWGWPASGKIIRKYSSKAPRKKGIGIMGQYQQRVNAAAGGKIVYSGNGLIGYGNLIIIKHNETYLSAYAHNNKVFVKEGQTVQRGQKLALMGRNENNTPMLHFEIRKNGKPVNPVRYLPKR